MLVSVLRQSLDTIQYGEGEKETEKYAIKKAEKHEKRTKMKLIEVLGWLLLTV